MKRYPGLRRLTLARSWTSSYLASIIDLVFMLAITGTIIYFGAVDSLFWYVMCIAAVSVTWKVAHELACARELWISEDSDSIMASGIWSDYSLGTIDDLESITTRTSFLKGRTVRIATRVKSAELNTWLTPSVEDWVESISALAEASGRKIHVDLTGIEKRGFPGASRGMRDDWKVTHAGDNS